MKNGQKIIKKLIAQLVSIVLLTAKLIALDPHEVNQQLIQLIRNKDCTVESIQQLLEQGADPNVVDDLLGETPLIWAAANGNLDAVQLLLQQPHINLNLQSKLGNTALMVAVCYGHSHVVELLLNAKVHLYQKNRCGETALTIEGYGVNCEEYEKIRNLLNKELIKQLHNSIHSDADFESIKKLLSSNKFDINAPDEVGKTALRKAVYWGHKKIVRLLLQAKARTDLVDDDNQTDLMTASRFGYEDIAKILLNYGAQTDAVDKFGNTALRGAIINNNFNIAHLLIDKKADINCTNSIGDTPLIEVSRLGKKANVAFLLRQKNISIDIRNKFKQRALTAAAYNHHQDVVNMLLAAKACPVSDEDWIWGKIY